MVVHYIIAKLLAIRVIKSNDKQLKFLALLDIKLFGCTDVVDSAASDWSPKFLQLCQVILICLA